MQKNKNEYFDRVVWGGVFLLGGWLLVHALGGGGAFSGAPYFLTLHLVLEGVSIVISALIFALGWHTFRMHGSRPILILACTFLGVAIADFSHMLSYEGMPDFLGPNSAERASGFWLLARYLAALGLLTVACLPWRMRVAGRSGSFELQRFGALLLMLLVVLVAHLVFFLLPEALPRAHVEGVGVTGFKLGAEYGLVVLNGIGIALLLKRRIGDDLGIDRRLLAFALCVMAMSELFFALHGRVADLYNLSGHLYKIIAYLILYRAIFVESVLAPYKSLQESRQHVQIIMAALPDVILEMRLDGRLLSAHVPQGCRLFRGLSPVPGADLQALLPAQAVECLTWTMRTARSTGREATLKFQLEHAGDELIFEASASLLARCPDQGHLFVVLIRDVTEQARNQFRIEQLAHFDALTGLPNRTMFAARFDLEATRCRKEQRSLALIFMDLNNFKNVNDTLGHKVGDDLLVRIASRLKKVLSFWDMVSRQGGDEFMFLLPGADQQQAGQVAERIRKSIERPVQVGQYELHVSASMGIALFPRDGQDLETLASHADIAMYRAKRENHGHYAFFTEEMQASTTRALVIEGALREALRKGQLEVYYQLQFDMSGERLVGAEALLRWFHPELGLVSPAEFIPVAEVSGQIITIGDFVLRRATQQMKLWLDAGFPEGMSIAVNVSMAQFRDTALLERIDLALATSGLPPSALELELTETVAMENPEQVVEIVKRLRSRGIRLSIDDFGTGYSSLSYLRKLQVHKLKIDRSFILGIAGSSSDQSIVQAIISLAGSLGMQTIAEGVETEEQCRLLESLGCHFAQGYLFSRPLPAAEIMPLLRAPVSG